MILLNTIAPGTKAVVKPWGREIPGKPLYSSMPGAVISPITITITMFSTAAKTPISWLLVRIAARAPVKAKCQ